jgi:hypothetical protein
MAGRAPTRRKIKQNKTGAFFWLLESFQIAPLENEEGGLNFFEERSAGGALMCRGISPK